MHCVRNVAPQQVHLQKLPQVALWLFGVVKNCWTFVCGSFGFDSLLTQNLLTSSTWHKNIEKDSLSCRILDCSSLAFIRLNHLNSSCSYWSTFYFYQNRSISWKIMNSPSAISRKWLILTPWELVLLWFLIWLKRSIQYWKFRWTLQKQTHFPDWEIGSCFETMAACLRKQRQHKSTHKRSRSQIQHSLQRQKQNPALNIRASERRIINATAFHKRYTLK
jgi:hypothetical protein